MDDLVVKSARFFHVLVKEMIIIKNQGGRPKKEIDQQQFEVACSIQCTKDEICDLFDCDEKTVTRWCKDTYGMSFSDIYKKKSATGKISLRRAQFRMAEKNATMAIFLGKQYLGQRDYIEVENKEIPKVELLLSKIESEASK